MGVLGKLIGGSIVTAAAFGGNWLGYELRRTGDQSTNAVLNLRTSAQGQRDVNVNVVISNLVPALLVGLLAGRPRTLWAFVGGTLASALLGTQYEQPLIDQIKTLANSQSRSV